MGEHLSQTVHAERRYITTANSIAGPDIDGRPRLPDEGWAILRRYAGVGPEVIGVDVESDEEVARSRACDLNEARLASETPSDAGEYFVQRVRKVNEGVELVVRAVYKLDLSAEDADGAGDEQGESEDRD